MQFGEISLAKDIPDSGIDPHLNSDRVSIPIREWHVFAASKLNGAESKETAILVVRCLKQVEETPRTRIRDREL
jgi:hypothetical protein